MADPIEGMARAMYERSRQRWPDMPPWETAKAEPYRSDVCAGHWTDEARAAWAYALEAMNDPRVWWENAPANGVMLSQWRELLRAFARLHGIEPPTDLPDYDHE